MKTTSFTLAAILSLFMITAADTKASDFDNEGFADLLFQNSSGQIGVWYLNGSGTLTSARYLYTGGTTDWKVIATADLNGDGNADFVFQNGAGQLAVWY